MILSTMEEFLKIFRKFLLNEWGHTAKYIHSNQPGVWDAGISPVAEELLKIHGGIKNSFMGATISNSESSWGIMGKKDSHGKIRSPFKVVTIHKSWGIMGKNDSCGKIGSPFKGVMIHKKETLIQ